MQTFSRAAAAALAERGIDAHRIIAPLSGDVGIAAVRLAAHPDPIVAWGEPTLRLPPDHGEGGRAQQLALELARLLAGTERCALVVGSDGIDGPAPAGRPAPAGAYVDGKTWDAIAKAGIDPNAALAHCNAGPALAAVGALVITGPTGINHADLVVLG
jgi:hydroxypyruvate reductase